MSSSLDEWPPQYRELVDLICEEFQYNALFLRAEVSGKGGSDTYFAAPQAKHDIAQNVIVKCGPEEEVKAEFERTQQAVNYLRGCNYVKGVLYDTGRYDNQKRGCIVMELAGSASSGRDDPPPATFVDFFRSCKDSSKIETVLTQLFEERLNKSSMQGQLQNRSSFACHQLNNEAEFRSSLLDLRSRAALLLEWWNHVAACDKNSQSVEVFSHGDLHGGNILITRAGSDNPQPWIIDFGHTGTKHVFYDHARLERDIVLRISVSLSTDPVEEVERLYPNLPETSKVPLRDQELLKTIQSIEKVRESAKNVTLPKFVNWEKEYYTALYAQYMFAAGDSRRNSQIRDAALAVCELLQPKIETHLSKPVDFDRSTMLRGQVLWRLVYSFFRLDQLPSGGWSKTLAMWMEAIWDNDGGVIPRNPQMRSIGGTDQTSLSLFHYADRLERIIEDSDQRIRLFEQNRVVTRAIETMNHTMTSMGLFGGIEIAPPRSQIRHTAVAAASLLKVKKAFPNARIADDLITRCLGYVSANLDSWQQDTTNLYAMWGALLKISELLRDTAATKSFNGNVAQFTEKCPEILRQMEDNLARDQFINPKPEGTLHSAPEQLFPTPYSGFWRMQRSGFLMYFPLLVKEDGTLNEAIPEDLRQRFSIAFRELLREITADGTTSTHLMSYHIDPDIGVPRAGFAPDWGLSASLAATLSLPSVKQWLDPHGKHELENKMAVLNSSLLATFDEYAKKPEIFRFSTGPSFARYLDVAEDISVGALIDLDAELSKMLAKGVTEAELDRLVTWISEKADANDEIDCDSVRELLLDNLESGVHTPDQKPENWRAQYDQLCKHPVWKQQVDQAVQSAQEVYDGKVGDQYIEFYGEQPVLELVRSLSARDVFGDRSTEGMRALDVGCGPGQYAKLLQDTCKFKVDLLDVSLNMLTEAARRLKIDPPPPRDIYHLTNAAVDPEPYDLVFACAMMVHVPKERTAEIYRAFNRLLKPDGVLFVNYKIGDHTLISLDGRFYEHYLDENAVKQDLERAGFRVAWSIGATNRTNLYKRRRTIRWVNLYCRKDE